MKSALELLDDVEEELNGRAFLFDHPISYRDGVGAATEAIRVMLANGRRSGLVIGHEGMEPR